MRLQFLVAVIGSLLAVTILACNTRSSPNPKSSEPQVPPSISAAIASAQDVRFCDLISKPEQYKDKMVRTEAVFYANHENSALYLPECFDKNNYVWTDF